MKNVRLEGFDKEVLQSSGAVLVAGLQSDDRVGRQVELLKAVERIYTGRLKVCSLDQEHLSDFFGALGFSGTPIFLLFQGGLERNRFYGEAQAEDIVEFVAGSLAE